MAVGEPAPPTRPVRAARRIGADDHLSPEQDVAALRLVEAFESRVLERMSVLAGA